MPPYRADSGDESEVVARQDKEEDGSKKPEGPLRQMSTHQVFEETVERLHHPFREILHSGGHQRHFPGRHATKENDKTHRNPYHEHGVTHWKPIVEPLSVKWKSVMPSLGAECRGKAEEPDRKGCTKKSRHLKDRKSVRRGVIPIPLSDRKFYM